MKLEDKFSEGVDQNSNDIFALDFVSDNDGIVVGGYGPNGIGNVKQMIKIIMVTLFMRLMTEVMDLNMVMKIPILFLMGCLSLVLSLRYLISMMVLQKLFFQKRKLRN